MCFGMVSSLLPMMMPLDWLRAPPTKNSLSRILYLQSSFHFASHQLFQIWWRARSEECGGRCFVCTIPSHSRDKWACVIGALWKDTCHHCRRIRLFVFGLIVQHLSHRSGVECGSVRFGRDHGRVVTDDEEIEKRGRTFRSVRLKTRCLNWTHSRHCFWSNENGTTRRPDQHWRGITRWRRWTISQNAPVCQTRLTSSSLIELSTADIFPVDVPHLFSALLTTEPTQRVRFRPSR